MPTKTFVISCSCVDRPGIVAALSSRLAERGFNIEDSQQFDDVHTGQFFVRMVASGSEIDVADVRALLMPVIDQFGMTAQVRKKTIAHGSSFSCQSSSIAWQISFTAGVATN